MKKVNEVEYVWIKCRDCNDRVKVAKNKGAYFRPFDFLYDFFIMHSACNQEDIVLEFSDQ